jgi:hypothetical protein
MSRCRFRNRCSRGHGRLAVADVRGGHRDDQEQAEAVGHDVPLPPVDLLASVVAA